MGQTNDTPAERRTTPKPPTRRLPVPPHAPTTSGGNQPMRRATAGRADAGETAAPVAARPVPRAARTPAVTEVSGGRAPTKDAPPMPSGDDRILVFSTQRDAPREATGRERQQAAEDAPAALPRPRAFPIVPREGAAESTAGMVSLGDSLRDFVAVLEERRKRRLAEGHDRGDPPVLRSDLDELCPFCNGAGYLRRDVPVGHPLFGQPLPCECKEREIEERRHQEDEARLRLLDRFGSLVPVKDKTFDNFNAHAPGTHEAFAVASQYEAVASEDDAAASPGWLVLIGPPGTGKTHLAAAIGNKWLAAERPVYFAVVPELLDHLRAAFGPQSEITYDDMFECIRNVELLVLDDLGAQNSTPWAADKLFQIINHRYNYRYPTVITTNQRLHEQMDERIRSRLSDSSFVRTVNIRARDYRPRNGRRGE